MLMKKGAAISGVYVWIALLLCIVYMRGQAMISSDSDLLQGTTESGILMDCNGTEHCEYASMLTAPLDHTQEAKRESNRWATPGTSTSLQGISGRSITASNLLQRVVRTHSAAQEEQEHSILHQTFDTEQAVFAKRFHSGYYIYHRCQMRC